MKPITSFAALLTLIPLAACQGAPSAPNTPASAFIDEADPMTLTWVSPATSTDAQADSALELVVATQNSAAQIVHFAVDGAEVGVCDPSDPSLDCHQEGDDLWRWTVTAPSVGHHAASAWFTDTSGQTVTATMDLEVQVATDDSESGQQGLDGPDPYADRLVDEGDSRLVQDITGVRGSLDPNVDQHNVCGGTDWSVQNQRVLFASGRLDGSLSEIDRCRARYGDYVDRYADFYNVSRATVMATLAAYGNCGASPEWLHNTVSSTTCHAMNPAIAPADCRTQMMDDVDFAIHTTVRYIAHTRTLHHDDPPKIAAVLDQGAVRCSHHNRWHIASHASWIDRFVGAYNAYRTSETHGHHPPRCGRRVVVTVALYEGMGDPGSAGVPQDNGCWEIERVSKDNPEWEVCGYDRSVHHGSGATHWAYDDTNNVGHSVSLEDALISDCEHRAWSWGYVYMANRNGSWPRRITNAHRYFAEIYTSDNTVDDQYSQWDANRGAGEPMINLVPTASSDTLYNATRRLCSEVGSGGHLGLYVHTRPLEGAHLAAVVRALNDCTR